MTAPDLQPLELRELDAVAAALRGMPYLSDQLSRWAVLAVCAVVGEQEWRTEDEHPDPPSWPPVDRLTLCELVAVWQVADRLPAKTRQLDVFAGEVRVAVLTVVRRIVDASPLRRQGDDLRRDRQGRLL